MEKMKTIGFVCSHKENEKRIALLPKDLEHVQNCAQLYFEKGYGKYMNIEDDAYKKYGCHMVSRSEALKQDIICEPKIGDSTFLNNLKPNQAIFGWIHA